MGCDAYATLAYGFLIEHHIEGIHRGIDEFQVIVSGACFEGVDIPYIIASQIIRCDWDDPKELDITELVSIDVPAFDKMMEYLKGHDLYKELGKSPMARWWLVASYG